MASGNSGRGGTEVPALGGHDALASSSEQGGHVMPYGSVAHLDHVASVVVEHWVPSGRYGVGHWSADLGDVCGYAGRSGSGAAVGAGHHRGEVLGVQKRGR